MIQLTDINTRVRALQMEWLDRNRWPYTTSRMNPQHLRDTSRRSYEIQMHNLSRRKPP